MLLANKPTIVRQAAATAGPEEEKIKKFATAIVEFSKVKSDQSLISPYNNTLESDIKGREKKEVFDCKQILISVPWYNLCLFLCLSVFSLYGSYSAPHEKSTKNSTGRD